MLKKVFYAFGKNKKIAYSTENASKPKFSFSLYDLNTIDIIGLHNSFIHSDLWNLAFSQNNVGFGKTIVRTS